MIYGDPNKIAFQFDPVKGWNLEGSIWLNGLLLIYIAGESFLCNTVNITLNIFSNPYRNLLKNPSFQNNYDIKTQSPFYYWNLYRKLYKSRYDINYTLDQDDPPEEVNVPGLFDLTTEEPLSDVCKYIFIILGEEDVIMYGGVAESKYIILEAGTVRSVIEDMNKYPLYVGREGLKWEENYHYYASHEYENLDKSDER